MKNFQNTGYYGYPIGASIHRTKDITGRELMKIREAKETREAVAIVAIVFAIIITFALLAEHGNTYI